MTDSLNTKAWCSYRDTIEQLNASAQLLAVTKGRPASAIHALAGQGQRHVAESYWQEASEKISSLLELPLVWHFIGRLQSNKCAEIARHFDWVHSVCDVKQARLLDRYRPDDRPPLFVCLQVNVTGEPSKAGLLKKDVIQVAQDIMTLPRLQLKGLMTMLPKGYDEAHQREAFLRCAEWRDECEEALGLSLPELSMGMTQDYQQAVLCGSTWCRIGSGLFEPST